MINVQKKSPTAIHLQQELVIKASQRRGSSNQPDANIQFDKSKRWRITESIHRL